MSSKIFILTILMLISGNIFAQSILNQQITIPLKEYQIEELLTLIEQKSGARFSYNADIINAKRKIEYQAENKKVELCLNDIFDNKFRYQVSGKYIILLKKTTQSETQQDKKQVVVKGIITNKNDLPIQNVSIYNIENQSSAITDENGEFSFTFKSDEELGGFSVGKVGFLDTVLLINQNVSDEISISLKTQDSIFLNNLQANQTASTFDKFIFLDYFVPIKTRINSQNLSYIEGTRPFQISFLPGISSNLSKFGVLENNVSLNVLIGYSRGVNGFEVAGLMNFDKEDVKWVQIGGLTNVVGGNVNGFQAGGIANVVLGNSKSFQAGGIANLVKGDFNGVQTGGIFNTTIGDFKGVQTGGIVNLTVGEFDGVQTAGILNIAFNDFKGVQTGGILNFAKGKVDGIQISGIMNSSLDTVKGGQITGLVNVSKTNTMQLSGLLNVTKENNGIQIAPFNICDTSSGVSIGLISFVLKGYHKPIISADEIFYTNLNIHLGTEKFYNIFNVSYQPDDELIWGVGYGFGHKFILNNWAKFDLELLGKMINYQNKFSPYYKILSIGDFTIKQKVTIYLGTSFNYYIGEKTQNLETLDYISNTLSIPIFEPETSTLKMKSWIGFYFGISL